MLKQKLGGFKMNNLIDWIISILSIDGINSKGIVRTTLEEMSLDDWYTLRDGCNSKIEEMKMQGYHTESNPNVLILRSYQNDIYQCTLLSREITLLSNFVKGQSFDGMPIAPSCGNSVEAQHIKLLEAKHNLEELLIQRTAKLEKCLDLIEKVADPRGRYILTGLYLEGKDLVQVMREAPFELCYKQFCRIKYAALDEIRKIEVN